MSQSLALDPVLDLKAAAPLRAALLDRRGEALTIDASAVQRLGGLCLQVLLGARRAWAEDGRSLEVTPRSAAFDEALGLFGAADRFGERSGDGA